MSLEIGLATPDGRVEALVAPWLADARLGLPRPLELRVRTGKVPEPPRDDRMIFRQGRVEIRGRPGTQGDIELAWGGGLGHATVHPDSDCAEVVVSDGAFEFPNEMLRSFLLNVCIFLVRGAGLHHVHGASLIDPRGRGWLIVGTSKSGKSTTTALLARNGWRFGTDDIAFLSASSTGVDVVAWHDRLALRDDATAPGAPEGGIALAGRNKTGWFAEELGSAWAGRVTPSVLAFPSVSADAPTSARALKPTVALTRLMDSSPWVLLDSRFADEHLALMTRLVKQTRAWELSLGRDLFDDPHRLEELAAA